MRLLAWCLVLAACGQDVRLGTAFDASIDVAVVIDGHPDNPFHTGSYTLAFVDAANASCDGDLTGMEAAFMAITRTDVSFVDGTLVLEASSATTVIASGVPISMGFGVGSLTLGPEPDPPPGQPEVWGGFVGQSFGSGPLSTSNTERFFGLDASSGSAPLVNALGALLYETAGGNGACSVVFSASLTPQ